MCSCVDISPVVRYGNSQPFEVEHLYEIRRVDKLVPFSAKKEALGI
jgi:hypothetical protein